ncbi:MAG TPA: hypothetical protein VMI32_08445 [Candidatus Solibacter sp.]|nr:hypothetical protein [Candidatus Solibacter sp.]
MTDAPRETVERVSGQLAALLESARGALRGERDFSVIDVRQLQETIGQMNVLALRWRELQRSDSELAGRMEQYKSQLGELQTILEQIRIMLQSKQAGLGIGQAHNTAVSRWVSAFQQTR